MINTWNESLLHEELKDYFCGENGLKEVMVKGSICDAVTSDGTIIEIQTSNFRQLKHKLDKLLVEHKITLVYPVPVNNFIQTYDKENILKSKRKSPKHGSIFQIFKELSGIPHLIGHENLTLVIAFTDILEIRIADGTGTWRNKGIRKQDKKLLKIHNFHELRTKKDYKNLIPKTVPIVFTVKDLHEAGAGKFAGIMAWVLRKAEIIEITEKKGNAYVYRRKVLRTPLHKNR